MSRDEVLISTAQAATQLGVTRQRVLELITDERLPARKVGHSYVIRASDVASLELQKVGRPPKPKASGPNGKVNVQAKGRPMKKR